MTCYLTAYISDCSLAESSDIPFGNAMCPKESGKGKDRVGDLAELQHAGSKHVPAETQEPAQQLSK